MFPSFAIPSQLSYIKNTVVQNYSWACWSVQDAAFNKENMNAHMMQKHSLYSEYINI